jgi:hypothetical protein
MCKLPFSQLILFLKLMWKLSDPQFPLLKLPDKAKQIGKNEKRKKAVKKRSEMRLPI